jgi:diguanylate cyclase (GGDEF)-like protein
LNEIADLEDVEVIAGKIVDAFRKTFHIESRRLSVTTSMGLAIFPQDGNDAEVLVRRADAAMYAAKKSGKNKYCRFTPDME